MRKLLPLPFKVGQIVSMIGAPTITGEVTRIRRPANATPFSIRHNCSLDVRLHSAGNILCSISGCWEVRKAPKFNWTAGYWEATK